MKTESIKNPSTIVEGAEALHRYDGWQDCLAKVEKCFASKVARIEQITKGGNNGVFLFESSAGDRVIGKFYRRDSRNRLEREWHAYAFLRRNDFTVPDPLFRDTDANFAVYSFESGQHVSSEEASENDVFGLVDTVCRLHSFDNENITEAFPAGVAAAFCSEDIVGEVQDRIRAVQQTAEDGSLNPRVSKMVTETNILTEIQSLITLNLESSPVSHWNILVDDRRLSPVDFGFHNALFRGDAPPCIVDLEYFGWDDPLHAVADFLTHDTAQGLSESLRRKAIDRYTLQMKLSLEDRERLHLMCQLCDIRFMAIYLQSVTPRYLETRAFAAAGNFEPEIYISEQLEKIEKRRERICSTNREDLHSGLARSQTLITF